MTIRNYVQPKIAINRDLCVGCGMCAEQCANGVFAMDLPTGQAKITDEPCIHCGGECHGVCRAGAISVGYEN